MAGFNNSFTNPAPWYFRTLETWGNLFLYNGFTFNKIIEPVNPQTKKPASVIFIGELATNNTHADAYLKR